MGFADSLARGGWYEKDVSHAEKTVDDHHQVSQAPWADDPKACRIEIRLGSAVVWVHKADAQRLLPTLIEALKVIPLGAQGAALAGLATV